jgi:hypothetical protein
MNLFNRLFGNQSLKQCPRCLGKGHVDWDDIKKLNQELKWIPATCAYCNGTEKVDTRVLVPVDASYLVVNLPVHERKRILNGDPDALERAKLRHDKIDGFINQISYLHFETGLTPLQIAKFFLLGNEDFSSYKSEESEFVDYVERVIKKKKEKI